MSSVPGRSPRKRWKAAGDKRTNTSPDQEMMRQMLAGGDEAMNAPRALHAAAAKSLAPALASATTNVEIVPMDIVSSPQVLSGDHVARGWLATQAQAMHVTCNDGYTPMAIHRRLYKDGYTTMAVHRWLYNDGCTTNEGYTPMAIQGRLCTDGYTTMAI